MPSFHNNAKSPSVLLTLMILSLRMRHASWSVRSVLPMAVLMPDVALWKLPLAWFSQVGLTFFN